MRIAIRDETGESQRVEINKSIDQICVNHIIGRSREEPLPTYVKPNSNPCYGCIEDEYNKKCPRYIPASRLRVFEILENE